ncbi:hypothetical protein TrCOL_g527 [Triparma columacea]|uniref:Uncharacterized protein n=1 Tax=Triparma columacea TaxID=722753 RepID=A0A9W7G8C7_9STRA|nr:hypothetical protein TrCOL_g527 [Triparma columacea]
MKVMEFGVGHGLPLMTVCKCLPAPAACSFAGLDYNSDTVREKTWPNVVGNFGINSSAAWRMWGGDWNGLGLDVEEHQYDLLLFSETVYNVKTTEDTANLISRHLRDGGLAVVAGKDFYFGVGGGMNLFRDVCGVSGVEILEGEGWKWDSGGGNVRSVVVCRKKGGEEMEVDGSGADRGA